MMLFFVYIVFHVDPASGLPNTINVCVSIPTQIKFLATPLYTAAEIND